jgi:hypothetical protein
MATEAAEFQTLPVMTPQEVFDHFNQKNHKGELPGRVLVEAHNFIAMLRAVGGFEINTRIVRNLCSPRISLIDPPVIKDRKACFVFPDQFDRLGIILTLRQAYNLPLAAIRDLLERYPKEHYDLIMERKFEIEELIDLAKMLKNGYQLKDLIMAKAGDVLLQDVISSNATLNAALEPGDTLRRLQEKLLLARLDEMKAWVSSGKWQEFLRRESAQDFRDLAAKQLLKKKIVAKALAKKARSIRRGGSKE